MENTEDTVSDKFEQTNKPKISVSLDPETHIWLQENVRNRSAFIRELVEEYRSRSRVDLQYSSVVTTLNQLKGMGLILVPGKTYRAILELGLQHEAETLNELIRESGRLFGVYFSNYLRGDKEWLNTFQQILTDLFLDVNQVSVTLENETFLIARLVSAIDSEATLPLFGDFLEEALKRLGYNLLEWRVVFEQGIGMLSQKYTQV